MPNIIISGQSFFVYATPEQADEYLIPYPEFSTWDALTVDQKGQLLVQATRFLDQLSWKEECGLTQEERVLRTNIVNASIEIAYSAATGNTAIFGGVIAEAEVEQLKAGSTSITYRKTPYFYTRNPNSLFANIPPFILSMIKGCLSGTGTSGFGGAISYDTDNPSKAKEPWNFTR